MGGVEISPGRPGTLVVKFNIAQPQEPDEGENLQSLDSRQRSGGLVEQIAMIPNTFAWWNMILATRLSVESLHQVRSNTSIHHETRRKARIHQQVG